MLTEQELALLETKLDRDLQAELEVFIGQPADSVTIERMKIAVGDFFKRLYRDKILSMSDHPPVVLIGNKLTLTRVPEAFHEQKVREYLGLSDEIN